MAEIGGRGGGEKREREGEERGKEGEGWGGEGKGGGEGWRRREERGTKGRKERGEQGSRGKEREGEGRGGKGSVCELLTTFCPFTCKTSSPTNTRPLLSAGPCHHGQEAKRERERALHPHKHP